MNQMKNLQVSSTTTTNVTLTSAIQSSSSSSSRPISTASYLNDYEITDTMIQSSKKPTTTIAAFPPRHISTITESFSSKSNVIDNYEHDTSTSTISNEDGIRFGTTPGPQRTSVITPTVYVNRYI